MDIGSDPRTLGGAAVQTRFGLAIRSLIMLIAMVSANFETVPGVISLAMFLLFGAMPALVTLVMFRRVRAIS
jgi:hypothetical protein